MENSSFPIVITGHIDHGKSTLIGRLLFDTGALGEERYREILASSSELGKETQFAFVLDAFEEERKKGITIDTAQIYFQTARRKYVIIDAPGHKEFIKNMITGASYAEAAVLIIDAMEGIRDQTRRHLHLLDVVGIKDICILVNKMDQVGYSEHVFTSIQSEINMLMRDLSIKPCAFVPVSALHGVNVARKSPDTPWYKGPCLIEVFDNLYYRPFETRPFRFPVQDVYEADCTQVSVGRVESGEIGQGMDVVVLPQGKKAKIKEIKKFLEPDVRACSYGESVGIVLDGSSIPERGDVIAGAGFPHTGTDLLGNVFWFNNFYQNNEVVTLRCATQEVTCTLDIRSKFDPAQSDIVIENPKGIDVGEIAKVAIRTQKELVFDAFSDIPEAGRFILEKNKIPVGGGIILSSTGTL